ncbi:unnamed protein product [marine sediment metagenome]|uniref:Uncharacterized protein n=1 Tax=marine sediment metagenome TaxID=412755 RepID=X1HST9_9ZZZZ
MRYCGWADDKFCSNCGNKLKEISEKEFYEKKKRVIEKELSDEPREHRTISL